EPRIRILRARGTEETGLAKAHELIDEPLRGERRVIEQGLPDDSDWGRAERARSGGGRVERVTVTKNDDTFDVRECRIVGRRRLAVGARGPKQVAERSRNERFEPIALD